MPFVHLLRRAARMLVCGLTLTLLAPAASEAVTTAGPLWTGVPFRAKNPGPVSDPGSAPWTASGCAGNGYSLVDRPDGTGVFELHQGDRPSGAVGGDRCQLSVLDPYVIGLPATPNPEARWYRFDVAVPSDHPWIKGAYYQTLVEWHGSVAGQSALKIAITSGDQLELTTVEKVLGVDGQQEHWDVHPLAPGSWHSYVVELLTSPDPTVGYFRLYRDGRCRTCGDPRADAQGRVWRRTARTSSTGQVDKNSFTIGYYRDKAITVPTTSIYRDVKIGRTLAEVSPYAPSATSPKPTAAPAEPAGGHGKRAGRHCKRAGGSRKRAGGSRKRAGRHGKRTGTNCRRTGRHGKRSHRRH